MTLTEEIKQAITSEYYEWEERQYAGKSREERAQLDQFYTEPPATIKMLEDLDSLEGNILDPTVGCGGLLAAAIIAGADPKRCYGVELDPEIVKVCRERLSKLGVPKENIRHGNALNPDCFDFDHEGVYKFNPDEGPVGTVTYNDKKPRPKFRFGI